MKHEFIPDYRKFFDYSNCLQADWTIFCQDAIASDKRIFVYRNDCRSTCSGSNSERSCEDTSLYWPVVKELRATGPFTQAALGVTMIMDVVVIVLFAVNSSIADAFLTGLWVFAEFQSLSVRRTVDFIWTCLCALAGIAFYPFLPHRQYHQDRSGIAGRLRGFYFCGRDSPYKPWSNAFWSVPGTVADLHGRRFSYRKFQRLSQWV